MYLDILVALAQLHILMFQCAALRKILDAKIFPESRRQAQLTPQTHEPDGSVYWHANANKQLAEAWCL